LPFRSTYEFEDSMKLPSLARSITATPQEDWKEELAAYLGAAFDPGMAEDYLVRSWNARLRDGAAEVEEFYRSTDAYLYDLSRWHASRRFPYSEVVGDFARRQRLSHLLEFGCGIGTDGLKLLARGFKVTFYDFRNPSTEYLQWRLRRRGYSATILFAGEDELPPNDLTFAIDVIEHLTDPAAILRDIAARARAVVIHVPITTQRHKYPMHFNVDKAALKRVLRDQGFRRAYHLDALRYTNALIQLWEAPQFWLKGR
jgi:2-polyprenyl-3-methyl-5-hydroxy-6-metoxy-1,4-benzoquinol methylase